MAGEPAHGRIVMLVDNDVHGDSRVQKQARSAAAAGWDVILLGASPTRERQRWRLGDAQVELLPVPRPMVRRRYEFRRAPLRWPGAYPFGPLAGYRRQQLRARRVELTMRRAATGSRLTGLGSALLLKVTGRWVAWRLRRTRAAEQARVRMDAPLDRLTTACWQALMGDRCWRRLDPGLWDYELAYGHVIDKLRPDLIHANDFRMLGVGARAALRARAAGRPVKLVWDAHEYLPGIKPWNDNPRWHIAQCAHEREYARYADAVVTVSPALADLLAERHGLAQRPVVVLNAPQTTNGQTTNARTDAPDLRTACGLDADTPLAVYSGAAAPQRGLDLMVEALPRLPGRLHVAFVVKAPTSAYVAKLLRQAEDLDVADRVHVLPYVPYDQVAGFLATADLGVIPIERWPNHEIALITKFFEYSHARLPIVVSDVRTMAETTRTTGQGRVFPAGDVDGYVEAVAAVLAEPQRYRAAYDAPGLLSGWTWESQAQILDAVYRRLVPALPASKKTMAEVGDRR